MASVDSLGGTGSDTRPDWGHRSRPINGLPPPPYQLRECTFLMIGAEFDRALAQSLLPPGFEAADEATGGFYMYTASKGWAVAPLTATLAWIDVKGFDSADGSKGRVQVVAHYSGPFAQTIEGWNRHARRGFAELASTGSFMSGEGGPDGSVHLRMTIRVSEELPVPVAGTHYYIMETPAGGLQQVPVAYCYDWVPAEVERFENLAPAGTILQRMIPKRLHWAGSLTDGSITIGVPLPIGDGDTARESAAHVVHLNLLSQLGRGAIVATSSGRVVFQNEVARAIGEGTLDTANGYLHLPDKSAQSALAGAIATALDRRPAAPLVVARNDERPPLIVQVLLLDQGSGAPMGKAQPGEGLVILVITDPSGPVERDPSRALELLGLTKSESRIAALVGTGAPPKEAARQLGNTESTVRFALNQVYRKLNIGRQSELARIVSRIESVGL